ncbi:MAG: hypothetical protein WCI89_02740 [bacterium]
MARINLQKYVLALVITVALFATAFYIESRLDAQRVVEIRAAEESVSTDILSSETQFALLGSLDCETISQNPVLSSELNSLASRLSFTEDNLGTTNPEVINLKSQYSLLEIKDYLLMEQVSKKCGQKPVFILYFYSNAGDCSDCGSAGNVLTYLRDQYPGLRVYSFDYNLNLSALKTLASLRHVEAKLPAFIINDRPPVYGLKTFDEMQKLIPELKTLATSTQKTATSTYPRSGF